MSTATEKILSKYEEKISTLGFQLRDFLLKNIENITEQPDEPGNVIGFSYGTGYKDLICTIIPSKKGLKLAFYQGADLPDPDNLLEGTARYSRYLEIKSDKQIYSSALKQLIKKALVAYKERIRK